MAHKVFTTARERILQIWEYTDRNWGEDQADNYISELFEEFDRKVNG